MHILDTILDELAYDAPQDKVLLECSTADGRRLMLLLQRCRPSVLAAWDALAELCPQSAPLQLRYLDSICRRLVPRTSPTLMTMDLETETVASITHNVSVRLDLVG